MTQVIAHRGASAAAPENTVEAFRLAERLGADWVEFDVRLTGDGAAVVHHDACLADGRSVARLHAADLPGYVPGLAEALAACDGLGVHIEIKASSEDPDHRGHDRAAAAVAAAVAAGLRHDRVIVSSFSVDALDALRGVDSSLRTALICGIVKPAQAIAAALALEAFAVHPFDAMCDAAFVRRAHEAGLAVNAWTVNDPARMAQLLDMRVDGLITDLPDLARRVVDGRRLPCPGHSS